MNMMLFHTQHDNFFTHLPSQQSLGRSAQTDVIVTEKRVNHFAVPPFPSFAYFMEV